MSPEFGEPKEVQMKFTERGCNLLRFYGIISPSEIKAMLDSRDYSLYRNNEPINDKGDLYYSEYDRVLQEILGRFKALSDIANDPINGGESSLSFALHLKLNALRPLTDSNLISVYTLENLLSYDKGELTNLEKSRLKQRLYAEQRISKSAKALWVEIKTIWNQITQKVSRLSGYWNKAMSY